MEHKQKILAVVIAAGFTSLAGAQSPQSATPRPIDPVPAGTTTQIPQIQPGSGPVRITPPTVRSATLTLDGEVTAIDRENRLVTLRGDDGEQMTMVVGPDIERFEKLEVGDKVQARYTEAVAVALATGGSEADLRQKIESSAAEQPSSGKPGLGAVERTTIVANVFEIDKDAGTLTLRGPSGDPVKVRVQDQAALDELEVGNQLVMSYVQASVVSIADSAPTSGASRSTAESNTSSASSERSESGTTAQTRQDLASDSERRSNEAQTAQRADTEPGVTGALAGPSGSDTVQR